MRKLKFESACMQTNTMKLTTKTFSLLLIGLLGACSPKKAAESAEAVTGSQTERVAIVSKILSNHSPLPGPLVDGNFLQEKTGDGNLGPSDMTTFCAVKVDPANLSVWRAALKPLEAQNTPAKYVSPKKPESWWLTAADFGGLEFFSANDLTGRVNGWLGIAPDGRIFVYSFTM
jgi:hypothetical protein